MVKACFRLLWFRCWFWITKQVVRRRGVLLEKCKSCSTWRRPSGRLSRQLLLLQPYLLSCSALPTFQAFQPANLQSGYVPNLSAARARALAASSPRFLGGAVV